MAKDITKAGHRCCLVCGWDSLQVRKTTGKAPILRGWRIGPQDRPSTLALSSVWYAALSKATKSTGPKQQVFTEVLESWIRNVDACHCVQNGVRSLLLNKENPRTSELLAVKPESRPWRYVLLEAWRTMRPPWEIAPEHPVVQNWQKLLADRPIFERCNGHQFSSDPRGDFARVERMLETAQKRVDRFKGSRTVEEILVATDPRG